MMGIKMTGDIYEDVKIVHEAICDLHSMVGTLEKECMVRDEGKIATELFIRINGVKKEMNKIVSEYEHILRRADFCPPLNGMFIAEVKECPNKAQKGE